ncbi:MAG: GNAT family N-acetyltransferase [Acidimicrobiales bacterium]
MAEIRAAAPDDRAGIALVTGVSFNFQVNPEDVSVAGALCAFEGARLVGTARAVPFRQWFGGSQVPCAGVAGVAVLPEFRGRGVAGLLMRELLGRRRSQDDAVSTLYPANSALYRELGYEFAGLRSQLRAPVVDLPPARGVVRELAQGDLPQVMACFSRYASGQNGPVESSDPARWTDHILAHRREGTHQRTVVVDGKDGIDGYASYFLDNWETGSYGVHCKHLVATTPAAFLTLLGHLRRFENAARDVAWYGPPSTAPLGLVVASSGFALSPRLRRWMLRVLDVRRALECRGYPCVAAEAVISVDDPLFPANSGPWFLQVDHGRARVTPAGAGQVGAGQVGAGQVGQAGGGQKPPGGASRPLPIGLFSALYSGLATPDDLVLMGALDPGDPRLSSLTALFSGPLPWMPDFF